MDQSYSESDVSLSPSKIFERLQMLRQLQIMQRGKLQKYRSQCQDSPEISSSVTEIVSHFSNSTSYNTFRSLLQSSQEKADHDSSFDANISTQKQIVQDYIEGVSALNLSQESEFITESPVSTNHSRNNYPVSEKSECIVSNELIKPSVVKNKISLDEMPILSPKKNFEELIIEKLESEKITKTKSPKTVQELPSITKKTFLKRGEGLVRFGIIKKDLIIQNTKSLPWRSSNKITKAVKKKATAKNAISNSNKINKELDVQIVVTLPKTPSPLQVKDSVKKIQSIVNESSQERRHNNCSQSISSSEGDCNKQSCENKNSSNTKLTFNPQTSLKTSNCLKDAKGKTWASVLTTEQDNFLRQLKQSDYYKNFISPTKSIISDTSVNETHLQLRQDREAAEQNMFELLEKKVTHESFNLNNSFIKRFLKKGNLDCSGESTPLVLQKCLYNNPDLLHLNPESPIKKINDNSFIDTESCSDYTECGESCISASTCCSCQKSRVNESHSQDHNKKECIENKRVEVKETINLKENKKCLDDIAKINVVNNDMAEMNAKLIATSELLKDRLRELEDEIETFRRENANMTKVREELDMERQKFYEEKTSYEQKYNEEKILSEYYLAEEKEKLSKQKQTYDRYIRDMRGKLAKKEKDEIITLKKEVSELKEEIRNKDARSTSTIARLRNQIKIMEKERKTLQDEVEKLKKENRRIQHSNDITRRLSNIKYLEQINQKLAHMSSKDVHSEANVRSDIKYKAFEIERQSRNNKIQSEPACVKRRRAKSVPNLNVTSRYAKYFSQKDSTSDKESNKTRPRPMERNILSDDDEDANFELESENEKLNDSYLINESNSEDDNNLEKIYNERFQSFSPTNNMKNDQDKLSKGNPKHIEQYNCTDGFFIQKSNMSRTSKLLNKNSISPNHASSSDSIVNTSKSPISILSQKSCSNSMSPVYVDKNTIKDNPYVNNRSRSPISISSNWSSASQQSVKSINKEIYFDKRMIPSPEPSINTTSISKTDLRPTEIKKSDGARELRFPNGNVKHISADGKYCKFIYYNGDVKENFYDEGRIKYFYAETKTYHTTHADGLEILEFSDGQVEKRYKDGSSEIRLPNGSVRYFDPKNEHIREEWRFPDGAALTVSASGEQRIVFSNGQVEVHAKDHKRREFPDGTVKLVYNDGTSETRYASGRVRIKDKQGNLIMDSAPG